MTPNPKLRHPIDIKHEIVEDKHVLIVRCPIGIAPMPLALIPDVLPLIASFDGSLSVSGIAQKFSEQGATEEIVTQLANLLDQNFFLEGERYTKKKKEITEEYEKQDVRPAALAGGVYHAQGDQLIQELQSYLALSESAPQKEHRQMVGLVAPHIDYRRGHGCYGKTFASLEQQKHDLYVLIGTSHQYSPHTFHLSRKHFDSPLGAMTCDRDFMDDLSNGYGVERSFADAYLHKQEHSLELQVPFLKHLQPATKIAPVLVGSFHEFLMSDKAPHEFEQYEAFAETLTSCIKKRQEQGQRIAFIAGVDMAHIGRVFGDKGALTEEKMQEIGARDKIYLDAILEQNKKALYDHIAEDGDARRICGYPTMYLILDVFERLGIRYTAELIEYQQAVDYRSDCAVTFAGLALYN